MINNYTSLWLLLLCRVWVQIPPMTNFFHFINLFGTYFFTASSITNTTNNTTIVNHIIQVSHSVHTILYTMTLTITGISPWFKSQPSFTTSKNSTITIISTKLNTIVVHTTELQFNTLHRTLIHELFFPVAIPLDPTQQVSIFKNQ